MFVLIIMNSNITNFTTIIDKSMFDLWFHIGYSLIVIFNYFNYNLNVLPLSPYIK